MPNNYAIIQQMIGYLQEFEKDGNIYSLEEFARWFASKIQKADFDDSRGTLNLETSKSYDEPDERESGSRQHFISMVSRLSKCQDFYAKKFFDGLPINTLLEYNFLYSLNKSDILKKMDIIHIHMVEYTTGIDILKRLQKLNLITEFRDAVDKRNKRLRITSEGKRILVESMLRMNKMYETFLSCIPRKSWLNILAVMDELNVFHNRIFIQYNNKSYVEIIRHIDHLNAGNDHLNSGVGINKNNMMQDGRK